MSAAPARALHLGRRAHRVVRFLHLAVNGVWLGAVVSSALLVSTGDARDPRPYLAAYWLHDNIVVWAAGVVIFTALYFSLYTPWGLVRRWWVIAKWIGLFFLGVGIPFVATPVVNSMASYSDLALATGTVEPELASAASQSLTLLLTEAVLLLLLFVVSVWRPGGETSLRWEEKRFVRLALISLAVVGVGLSLLVSLRLEQARETPVDPGSAAGVPDGAFDATIDWLGVDVGVEVTVHDGRIERLRVLEQPSGHYPELGALVTRKVENVGHLDVDGVSGATTSSRAILVAAADALDKGR